MRSFILTLYALCLCGCASIPGPTSKQDLAREVFELSGGVDDIRLALRMVNPGDDQQSVDRVARACRQAFGRDPSVLALAACDAAQAAMGVVRAGQTTALEALEQRLDSVSTRAASAMAETYTIEELRAMRRFYASPDGRSIVRKRADYWARLGPALIAP